MVDLSSYNQFYHPASATANAWDVKTGKTAFLPAGKVTGTGYFPAMMKFDGTTGYYDCTFTSAGNLITLVAKFNIAAFAGGGNSVTCAVGGPTGIIRGQLILRSSDHANTSERNKLVFASTNSSGATILRLFSTTALADGNDHTVFASFNGTTGAATFFVDGVAADDVGQANRVAPTTGALESGASSGFGVGAYAGGLAKALGRVGFVGHRDAYITNWSDFMETDGTPKQLDESGWTEWGAQPLFWHESGHMDENKGSAGAMTKNGTITLAAASTWS